jgi:hypothetical protein
MVSVYLKHLLEDATCVAADMFVAVSKDLGSQIQTKRRQRFDRKSFQRMPSFFICLNCILYIKGLCSCQDHLIVKNSNLNKPSMIKQAVIIILAIGCCFLVIPMRWIIIDGIIFSGFGWY